MSDPRNCIDVAAVTSGEHEALLWFMKVLNACPGRGRVDAGDWAGNPINLWSDDFAPEDTFNRAIRLGLAQSSHDSDTDCGSIWITDAGRLWVATQSSEELPLVSPLEGEGSPATDDHIVDANDMVSLPQPTGEVESLIDDIRRELDGVRRGFAERRCELLFRAADALFSLTAENERLRGELAEAREDARAYADVAKQQREWKEEAEARAQTAETSMGEVVEALREARDLLMERRYGNPARSPGHNARLEIEAALSKLTGETKTASRDHATTINAVTSGETPGRVSMTEQAHDGLLSCLGALRALEPYLDAIVCYASSMDEHEPNRLVVNARTAITKASGHPS